jgi:hypothetical protein
VNEVSNTAAAANSTGTIETGAVTGHTSTEPMRKALIGSHQP